MSSIAVLGPARPPSAEELTGLPANYRITELQTPAATLGWAVPGRHVSWALDRLQGRPADAAAAPSPGSNINMAND
jgi:hypothetical protein